MKFEEREFSLKPKIPSNARSLLIVGCSIPELSKVTILSFSILAPDTCNRLAVSGP